ncbi:MAG TPA: Hpt domain-containing protein [Bacteroidales bacterium]|nr:Hpt domain-containing protein [Bacteroidales bacterium]
MINEKLFHEKYVHFDKETVAEIIDIFIKEYQERIDRLRQNLETRDMDELLKNAHAFKGSISNFDMDSKACKEISKMEEEVKPLLQEVKQGRPLSQNEEEEFFEKLDNTFQNFKKDSRRLVGQIKELRKHYDS